MPSLDVPQWQKVPLTSSQEVDMFDDNIINLTLVHPWMTFEEAHLLIKWSYYKNMSQQGKFGDNTVKTLMSIDYGMFQWQPREWIEERIEKAKKQFNYKG